MTTDADAQYRVQYIEAINSEIFQLVYYGRFSFQDCESMTSVELKWFYKRLIETKDAENEQRENAVKEAKLAREVAKNSQASRPKKRRKH